MTMRATESLAPPGTLRHHHRDGLRRVLVGGESEWRDRDEHGGDARGESLRSHRLLLVVTSPIIGPLSGNALRRHLLHSLAPLLAPRSVALIGASEREGSLGRTVYENLLRGDYKGRARSGQSEPARPSRTSRLRLAQAHRRARRSRGHRRTFARGSPHFERRRRPGPRRRTAVVRRRRRRRGARLGARRPRRCARAAHPPARPRRVRRRAHRHRTQRHILRAPGEAGTARARCAVRCRVHGIARFRGSARHRLLDRGLPRRGRGRRIRRAPRSARARSWHRRHPALRRVGRRRPRVHVRPAHGRAHQARRRPQGGPLAERVPPIDAVGEPAISPDRVFDAALDRAGTVRVRTYTQLIAAARILALGRIPQGDRLAIVANGRGPGMLAADSAVAAGVRLAELAESTRRALEALLPEGMGCCNPVDVRGDAPPARFADAVSTVLSDSNVDAVVALHVPRPIIGAVEAAQAVASAARDARKPVLGAWLGAIDRPAVKEALDAGRVANFYTPENAVDAFALPGRLSAQPGMAARSSAVAAGSVAARPARGGGSSRGCARRAPAARRDAETACRVRHRVRADARCEEPCRRRRRRRARWDIPSR